MILLPDLRRSEGSSVPAGSLWWLEKHFGRYYTLLFFPSAVYVCSLTLRTIKTTTLAHALRARHRKLGLVKYPQCDPPSSLHVWMKRFCSVHQRDVFCLYWIYFISILQGFFHCSISMIRVFTHMGHDSFTWIVLVSNLDPPTQNSHVCTAFAVSLPSVQKDLMFNHFSFEGL